MIYTVTFNPALDYVISVDHFTPGKINRTVSENMICGGKGINVSALLANLGYESKALGFVAGFTGAEIEKRAKELGFASDFIHVKKGMSRINVKMKSDEETEINGMGPDIQQEDVDALFEKLDRLKKGDVLGVARIAGIMGAKKTSELIPLCHILNLTSVTVDFIMQEESSSITAVCETKTTGKTGVEMEALTGVQISLLTIYDMCKSVDKTMEIYEVCLCSKSGGKSGDVVYRTVDGE